MSESFVPDNLKKLAELFEERNKTYGSNYKEIGFVLHALFPEGICVNSHEDWSRFGCLFQMISKLTRYVQNFESGGHRDSLDDLSVYAQMLSELDDDCRALRGIPLDVDCSSNEPSRHEIKVNVDESAERSRPIRTSPFPEIIRKRIDWQ